jgi:SAM-dependent methyltransferase
VDRLIIKARRSSAFPGYSDEPIECRLVLGLEMINRVALNEEAQAFFEALWKEGDYWNLERSAFERAKYDRQFAILEGRRYARTLEVGCAAGVFTRRLANVADRIVALDISPTAIERAKAAGFANAMVEFRVANVLDYDLEVEGSWDLIVMSETIYYLGWLYPFFDVGWLALRLLDATCAGGRLLMANTCGGVKDYLLRPWLIRTYRDLFLNVGYTLETEEVFRGAKDGVPLEVLISVFCKRSDTIAGSAQ